MIAFAARTEPLEVAGLFAHGSSARALAAKLRARLPLASIAVVRASDAIVAIGAADELPWIDGAIWLGRDPLAPGLLLPTRLAVSPHAALVLAALELASTLPIALVPVGERVLAIPLGAARAPGAVEIDAFLAERVP